MDGHELRNIAAELDAVHSQAKQAFQAKDLNAYMDVFSPQLTYKQADGRVIDRDQLTRDVADQFASVRSMNTSYFRESIEASDSKVTEVLQQTAWAEVGAFTMFRRKWKIQRRGRYVWTKTSDGWKIIYVEIMEENVG
jgi:ketosteroid isomerase-like protein